MRPPCLLLLVALVACNNTKPSRPIHQDPSPAPACSMWKNATSVTTSFHAGRADFNRTLHFDFATNVASVQDSDPFASGKELPSPRVIKTSKFLTQPQINTLVRSLQAVCPSQEALKRRCAPGGCMHAEVASAAGPPVVIEDADSVQSIQKAFQPLFPDLRWQ